MASLNKHVLVIFVWLTLALSIRSAETYQNNKTGVNLGSYPKWSPVTVTMSGPDSDGNGYLNPFSILVDVIFEGPRGKQYSVPGFYDGDGKGQLIGNVWKVRFAADEIGRWRYRSISTEDLLDGHTGSFEVTQNKKSAEGFYNWGRLEYTGTYENGIRYLKFKDGPYWLKAGCDDPENFLGSLKHFDSLDERKAAIDYLSNRGINSFYIMTHNIDGDYNDVWPWLGKTSLEAKSNAAVDARFDVAKLKEWRSLFEYMQRKSVVPYLILEDDSAWTGYHHGRYYREIVARFGDLPALLFNIGEEYNENYSMLEAFHFLKILKAIDPYEHPSGIHNVNNPDSHYINNELLDFTSVQTKFVDPLKHNKIALDWINSCKKSKRRTLMIGIDEGRPQLDRKAWWSAYVGGAVWEAHTRGPYDRPMSTWETAWKELGGTRKFMESLPFWKMEPNNGFVTSGTGVCLAWPGEAYALYLPHGGTVTVDLTKGITYTYRWWNPSNDRFGRFEFEGTSLGGSQQFTAPGDGDWALQIEKMKTG